MPTAGKATGAFLFALLALAVAGLIVSDLPPGVPHVPAALAAAAFGALTGWRIIGDGARTLQGAAARGLTTAVAAAFWTLLFGATWLMLQRSLRGNYDGPVEALADIAALMADLGRVLLDPVAATTLIVGGALAGIVTAAVARRLP
jgi:hypothetical protein